MSERPEDDVRAEQRRVGARQRRQQQHHPGDGATGAQPSPGAMQGQPWTNWLEATRLHGADELDEALKEIDKKREAMRLSKEDMPIFGLCPAYDEFYLVVCSQCNQVIKPQAFQSHYERRHGSSSKAPLTPPSSSVYSLYSTPSTKNKVAGSSTRTSSSASSNSKLIKSPKEKLQIGGNNRSMHPTQYSKAPQDKIMTPSVKVEKMHTIQKTDGALQKSAAGSTCFLFCQLLSKDWP